MFSKIISTIADIAMDIEYVFELNNKSNIDFNRQQTNAVFSL